VSTARVDFTRGAAERIARVVRLVEQGDRNQSGPTWDRVDDSSSPMSLRRCIWAENWPHNSTAVVAFVSGPSAQVTATNVFLGAGPGKGWVAKSGTSGWSLVSVDLTTQPGFFGDQEQIFGHSSTSGLMQWYSISNCGTASSSTATSTP
jgi:hypothetical protein